MKKTVKEVRSKPNSQAISKSRKPVAKPASGERAKPDFIGRLEGVFRIVGDVESPIELDAREYD
jgi:hypothetical protein